MYNTTMNLNNSKTNKPFHFLITPELKAWLDKTANQAGMSTASYVRSVLLKIKNTTK
jgi:hypothetical protein